MSFAGTERYVATDDLKVAVNAAIRLERPLLVKGEPGTGKTVLAIEVARALGAPLIEWHVKSTTRAAQGLYEYDAVMRLRDSQLGDARANDIANYIKRGKLWESFESPQRPVLLIDEIDKADIEFPNDLLLELDRMEFHVYETGETIKAAQQLFHGDVGKRIAAVEALGLKPVVVSSLGSSMFGANDPEFGWLDMESTVRDTGVWRVRTAAVVLGGESATAESLSGTGRDMLLRAAHRNGYEPIVANDLAELKRSVLKTVNDAAPEGLTAVINVGGSVLGIGTCLDAYGIASGIITRKIPCDRGVSGLVHDFAARNVPVLHLLYIKRLALDWGLPYDPVPLPDIGENKRIYGRMPLSPEIQ